MVTAVKETADSGDGIHFGSEERFSFLRILLSTPGIAGTVDWAYWSGAEWVSFTPNSGAYHFTQANAGVRLFADGVSVPDVWQRTTVNGINHFWIRATVISAYTTAPIGSQITAIPNTTSVIALQTS